MVPIATNAPAALPVRETKFARADLTVGADGSFSGYASLFGKVDLGRDMVMPGAFAASLAKRGAGGVKLLFQHDPNQPIGVWDELREDGSGLFVRGRLTTEVARAREVLSLMRAGALDGLSIGFKTVRARTDPQTGVRRLLEVDLWEISVVTFPMLPDAKVSAVKAARAEGRLPTIREFERFLVQDAGFSRSEARTVIRTGFKSLSGRRDATGDHEEPRPRPIPARGRGGWAAVSPGLSLPDRLRRAALRIHPKGSTTR